MERWTEIEKCIAEQIEIIRLQNDIIDKLAACLLMHIEADDMPCLDEIRRVALATKDIRRD